MSLLQTVKKEDATGKIKEIYEDIHGTLGMVPNVLQMCSLNSDILEAQWRNTKSIMGMKEDDRKLHIIIRLLVSDENSCKYCIGIYSSMLINMFRLSTDDISKIKENPSTAPLDEKRKALLLFTLQTTKNPKDITREDIKQLEELGITQKEIFDAVHNAAYIAVMNTLSNTFKVEIDF